MSNKDFLLIKILSPFLLNIPLFFIIYNKQNGPDYVLTNTFFYQGIINIVFGIFIIYMSSNFKMLGNQGKYEVMNRANLKRALEKDSGNLIGPEGARSSVINNRIKTLFIFIGIGFIIAAIVTY